MFLLEEIDDIEPLQIDDPVRVLICDQHDLVRRSLTTSLEEGRALEVASEAADGRQAVAESRHVAPDIAFVSLVLPELPGVKAIRLIAELMPGIDMVALAVEEDAEERFDALQAGACGVIDKEEVLAEPQATIERLLRGLPYVDADLAALLLDRGDAVADDPAALHDRERAVLQRMADGDEGSAIADDLGMLSGEVRNHVLNALRRLQASASPAADPSVPGLLTTIAS